LAQRILTSVVSAHLAELGRDPDDPFGPYAEVPGVEYDALGPVVETPQLVEEEQDMWVLSCAGHTYCVDKETLTVKPW
jgi:hypothetical protein